MLGVELRIVDRVPASIGPGATLGVGGRQMRLSSSGRWAVNMVICNQRVICDGQALGSAQRDVLAVQGLAGRTARLETRQKKERRPWGRQNSL